MHEDHSACLKDHKMSPFQQIIQESNPIKQEITFQKPQFQRILIERNKQDRISKLLIDSGSPTPIVRKSPISRKQSNHNLSLNVHQKDIINGSYIQIENNNLERVIPFEDILEIQGTKMNIKHQNGLSYKMKLAYKPQTQNMRTRIKKNEQKIGTYQDSEKHIQTQVFPQKMCSSEKSNEQANNKNERVYSQQSQQSVTGNTEKMYTPNETKLRANFEQGGESFKKFRQKSSINPIFKQNIYNNQLIICFKQSEEAKDENFEKNQETLQNLSQEKFQIVKVSEFQINLPTNIVKDKSNVPTTANINDRNLNSE